MFGVQNVFSTFIWYKDYFKCRFPCCKAHQYHVLKFQIHIKQQMMVRTMCIMLIAPPEASIVVSLCGIVRKAIIATVIDVKVVSATKFPKHHLFVCQSILLLGGVALACLALDLLFLLFYSIFLCCRRNKSGEQTNADCCCTAWCVIIATLVCRWV